MKKITKFKTDDGKEFYDSLEAEIHEIEFSFKESYFKWDSNADDFFESLKEDPKSLAMMKKFIELIEQSKINR